MKNDRIIYYSIVVIFFLSILFSVRYVVNTTRIIIDYEQNINPTEIFWEVDKSDSTLRIQEPLYLSNNYYLSEKQKNAFYKDSIIGSQLYADSLPNKGSILNLKPPFVLWKSAKNDTVKVYKNQRTLKFVKKI